MSLLQIETEYLVRFRKQGYETRLKVDAMKDADITVASLASWMGQVLSQYSGDDPQAYFRSTLADYDGRGPVDWCKRRKLPLIESVSDELARYQAVGADALSPVTAYVLGRAAMMGGLESPAKTQGLTLPIRFVEHLENSGMAWAGAVEWLGKQADKIPPDVAAAIDAEIEIYSTQPLTRLMTHESEYLRSGAAYWKDAKGLEQSLGVGAFSGLIDPDLRPVLMTIAKSDPGFVAKRLDKFGLPALTAGVLSDKYETDETVLLELLMRAPLVVDREQRWTKSFAARLILDELEQRCLLVIEDRNRQLRMANQPMLADDVIKVLVEKLVMLITAVLRSRQDGARLIAEWLAHLIDKSILRSKNANNRGSVDFILIVTNHFIDSLSRVYAEMGHTGSDQVWQTFGGKEALLQAVAGNDVVTQSELVSAGPRAVWINRRGESDHVLPFMVAVQRASASEPADGELTVWAATLLMQLGGEPYLFRVGTELDATVASYLAWPLGKEPTVRGLLGSIWQALAGTRLFARSKMVRDDMTAVPTCAALVSVSTAAVWSSSATLDESERKALALDTATMLDELRHGMHAIGLSSWETLVGRLSALMANSGLLNDTNTIAGLVGRYVGSDEDLANCLVNAARTDSIRADVVKVLDKYGISAEELANRWAIWNDKRIPNTDSLGSDFFKGLRSLATLQASGFS